MTSGSFCEGPMRNTGHHVQTPTGAEYKRRRAGGGRLRSPCERLPQAFISARPVPPSATAASSQ